MLCTATPDISSSSENIDSAARVFRLSFRIQGLQPLSPPKKNGGEKNFRKVFTGVARANFVVGGGGHVILK